MHNTRRASSATAVADEFPIEEQPKRSSVIGQLEYARPTSFRTAHDEGRLSGGTRRFRDFAAIERLLAARYGYWDDDVAHDDPFPEAV